MTFTIEDIPKMSHEELCDIALKYYKHLKRSRKENNRSYQKPKIKKYRQKKSLIYYYVKNDIYHPELNSNGTKERKYKRTD